MQDSNPQPCMCESSTLYTHIAIQQIALCTAHFLCHPRLTDHLKSLWRFQSHSAVHPLCKLKYPTVHSICSATPAPIGLADTKQTKTVPRKGERVKWTSQRREKMLRGIWPSNFCLILSSREYEKLSGLKNVDARSIYSIVLPQCYWSEA